MTDPSPQRRQRIADPEPVEHLQGVPHGFLAHPVYLWKVAEDGTPLERVDHRAREFVLRPRDIPTDGVIRNTIRAAPERLDIIRRGWANLRRRRKDDAAPIAVNLAHDGLIELTAATNPTNIAVLGAISGWRAAPSVQELLDQRITENEQARDTATVRATAAATALHAATVECDASSLRAALETHASRARPNVRIVTTLTAAAEALSTGDIYAGRRAFSQRHFDDSKAVDADQILAEAGVSDDIRRRIGVYRYGTIDIAGAITITSPQDSTANACLRGLPGPWTGLADRDGLRLACTDAVLVVIENKDPAQYLSRRRPDLAVWYLSGYSGPTQLEMLADLAATARETVAITDADAHGVMIASQVLDAVPNARIVDLGTLPHKPRKRPMDKMAASALLNGLIGDRSAPHQLRDFARAVMARGYDVEQDDTTGSALEHLLPKRALP